MTPDKIYVTTYSVNSAHGNKWGLWTERECVGDTYIRKDALLKWAKNLKEKWEEPPMSKNVPGCVFMLEQVIDKLKSM